MDITHIVHDAGVPFLDTRYVVHVHIRTRFTRVRGEPGFRNQQITQSHLGQSG